MGTKEKANLQGRRTRKLKTAKADRSSSWALDPVFALCSARLRPLPNHTGPTDVQVEQWMVMELKQITHGQTWEKITTGVQWGIQHQILDSKALTSSVLCTVPLEELSVQPNSIYGAESLSFAYTRTQVFLSNI